MFPHTHHRPEPYLSSDADVAQMLDAAGPLRPAIRAATTITVLGLLDSTGMRVGELLALGRTDVDLTGGVITLAAAKLDKQRLIPLHPSTTAALACYAQPALSHRAPRLSATSRPTRCSRSSKPDE